LHLGFPGKADPGGEPLEMREPGAEPVQKIQFAGATQLAELGAQGLHPGVRLLPSNAPDHPRRLSNAKPASG
jgi:hypothetical protein